MNDGNQGPSYADIDLAASDWVVRRGFGLTAEEQVDFARWAAADPRHAEALARHAQAWRMLDRPRREGNGDLVMRELGARATRRRRWRMGAATAAVAAACAIVLISRKDRTSSSVPAAAPVAGAVLLLPEKQILPDGSIVELNASAEITIDFSAALRRVILRRGVAHFEVPKDPQRPFVVSAAGIEVRAVGTAFAVQLGETAVEVLVTEGRVAVDRRELERVAPNQLPEVAGSAAAPPPEELIAGHRAVVTLADAVARIEPVPSAQLAQRLAWRAPRLEFSNTPLAEAVALMNRYSAVQIEIADPALARMRVNGLFRADHTDSFVRLLETSFDASAERSDERVVLRLQAARTH